MFKQILLGILISCISILQPQSLNAQTLTKGAIAFIGYNTDSPDGYTFITLADIPGNEIIYLGEEGWNDTGAGSWAGTTELHVAFTAPSGGIPCGTIFNLQETSTADDIVINSPVSGATVTFASGSNWNLSAGDQVLAYQAATAEPANPTFIAGVHGDDGNGTPTALDLTTGWNDASVGPLGVARSALPPGLTNGVDCVALFPALGTETDNAKYNGSLTGNSTVIRFAINDRTNWISDNNTPYSITPSDYPAVNINCIVAPVELSSFDASLQDNKVQLHWITSSEVNNEKFLIQSSADGINFHTIGEQRGFGTTLSTQAYSFQDEHPSIGKNFYRLKQIDFDGRFEYSPLRSIEIRNNSDNAILVFPNPATQIVHITTNDDSSIDEIKLYNIVGQEINITSIIKQTKDSNFTMDISSLKSGAYYIQTKANIKMLHIVN